MSESPGQCNVPASFLSAAESMGVMFDPGDLERLQAYLDLLYEANERMNLTGIKDQAEAWTRHLLDSLSLVPVLASVPSERVIDIGSGGGLPGIPLAIVTPDTRFVLLEATGKKAGFLRDATDRLGLDNVRVVSERAEDAANHGSAHRAAYDVVTARAVGPLPVLLELTVPFAKVGGIVAAIKGERASEEIEASAEALLALRSEVIDQQRTGTGTNVLVRKNASTPKGYPRRPGEPKRRPLGTDEPSPGDRRVR